MVVKLIKGPQAAMTTTTPPDWILVANYTRARIVQRQPGVAMEVLESFVHPAARGQPGGALVDARHKEYTQFAHELAQYLEAEARRDRFGALILFAPPSFLEELRAAIGKFTAALLVLTSYGVVELGREVARELAAVAH